jgi:NTE family protein
VTRVGLVLAGGGAKGAYQAGVVRRLADTAVPVAALAGCSIGALNGAVIASASDLSDAADRLAGLWSEVSAIAGPAPAVTALDGPPGMVAVTRALADLAARTASPVLRPGFLEAFVARRIDATALRRGLPLWVSVFPSAARDAGIGEWGWLLDVVRAWAGARAEWLHVNRLPTEEVHQAILASAALPVVLPGRDVLGRRYIDGGLADNTAAGALVRHGGCDVLIVTHLSRGDLWDAHQFPGTSVIEIRPQTSLSGPGLLGSVTATLDFSPDRVASLIRQGYADATAVLDRVNHIVGSVTARRRATAVMLDALSALPPGEDPL